MWIQLSPDASPYRTLTAGTAPEMVWQCAFGDDPARDITCAGGEGAFTVEVSGNRSMARLVTAWVGAPDHAHAARAVAEVVNTMRRAGGSAHSHAPARGLYTRYLYESTRFRVATVVPDHDDGRFEFTGTVEPYPGSWPTRAVTAARDGDYTELWPYLAADL